MWDDPVVFPEYHVSQSDWVGALFVVGYQILATAHREEEGKIDELVKGNQPWVGARSLYHLLDQSERDRFLLRCGGVFVFVSS